MKDSCRHGFFSHFLHFQQSHALVNHSKDTESNLAQVDKTAPSVHLLSSRFPMTELGEVAWLSLTG